jgi:hypothetical protein
LRGDRSGRASYSGLADWLPVARYQLIGLISGVITGVTAGAIGFIGGELIDEAAGLRFAALFFAGFFLAALRAGFFFAAFFEDFFFEDFFFEDFFLDDFFFATRFLDDFLDFLDDFFFAVFFFAAGFFFAAFFFAAMVKLLSMLDRLSSRGPPLPAFPRTKRP